MKRGLKAQWFVIGLAVLLAGCGHSNPVRPGDVNPGPTPTTDQQTFWLSGVVTQPVGVPIIGAKVNVLAGTTQYQSARTFADGRYTLPGVIGQLKIEIVSDGYAMAQREITMDHDRTMDVELTPLAAPVNVAGPWRVTFEASAACSDLPADARVRKYKAVILQQGAAISIELSGAELFGSKQFPGLVHGDGVSFMLGDLWDKDGIVEKLAENRYVEIDGLNTATAKGPTITGALEGYFLVGETPWRPYKLAGCYQSDHHVTFQRQ